MWFPRLASDRVLRACPVDGPFALTLHEGNANRLYCLNLAAERQGLSRGMSYSDARAFCPELISRPANPVQDRAFLHALRRWATRYCPWVGIEDEDGLVMDITGSAHLVGGEAAIMADLRARLGRAGLTVRLGLAGSRGAAWALSHFAEGMAPPGEPLDALRALPVAALRLEEQTNISLQRLGLRTIDDLTRTPRPSLSRRFGADLLMRLDQALGQQPESVGPLSDPPHYGVRLTLPEPIGLCDDVMAGAGRLLDRLCEKLTTQETGARVLRLTVRRVDQDCRSVELRLARPLRDAARILPLFARGVAEIDAGFGIDQLRLEAVEVEPLPMQQASHVVSDQKERLDDLITRIGTRIGLESIQRFLPADSHIPERSFRMAPAAYSQPDNGWTAGRPRPLRLFPPEVIAGHGPCPPRHFRWRRMPLTVARSTGPERIAPEWWVEDEDWRSGLRDYWHVETKQGRRLWLFHTPQKPAWFVQGEFA